MQELRAESNTEARVGRRGLLQRAAAGLAVAAGGVMLTSTTRDGEASPAPAATFGNVVTGNGPFGLKIANGSTASSASGVRVEMTAASPGNDAAAVRGTIGGANATTNAVIGSHRGKGTGTRGTSVEGAGVVGRTSKGPAGVIGITTHTEGAGVEGRATAAGAAGVRGSNVNGPGVTGITENGDRGVYGTTGNSDGSGVYGQASGGSAAGVYGVNTTGAGVWGRSTEGATGVFGESYAGGYGIFGVANAPGGIGVRGASTKGEAGVFGDTQNTSGSGVYGRANGANAAGVYGRNIAGRGVWGVSPAAYAAGAYGESSGNGGSGVRGVATAADGKGVSGGSPYIAILGETSGASAQAQGVRGFAHSGTAAWAGYFVGRVVATEGYSGASAATVIDHPLDPANRTLRHAHVASPEMKNVYDGMVTTGSSGKAIVTLAPYVEALNRNFRYQLTVIGGPAQAYISREVGQGWFEITTDRPSVKVSWQMTGVRRDAYATRHGLVVEEAKTGGDRGRYLHPAEHGQSASMAIPLNQPTGDAITLPVDAPERLAGPNTPRGGA